MTAVAPETLAAEPAEPADTVAAPTDENLVLADVLVEEISIDGMCGVY